MHLNLVPDMYSFGMFFSFSSKVSHLDRDKVLINIKIVGKIKHWVDRLMGHK